MAVVVTPEEGTSGAAVVQGVSSSSVHARGQSSSTVEWRGATEGDKVGRGDSSETVALRVYDPIPNTLYHMELVDLDSRSVSYEMTNDFASPICAKNGHMFWVVMVLAADYLPDTGHTPNNQQPPPVNPPIIEDLNLSLLVVHVPPVGATTTKLVKTGVHQSVAHSAPSIGIDEDGYLHLLGDMHGGDYGVQNAGDPTSTHVIYYRSSSAYDISSWETIGGSTVNGGLPGWSNTYPFFANAPNGKLYATYRSRYGSFGSEGANVRLCRWNTGSQEWDILGGMDITPALSYGAALDAHDKSPCLFFSRGGDGVPDGSGNDALRYQNYNQDILIDQNGRMHVTTVQVANYDLGDTPVAGNSMATLYAYSDDEGETWRRADGSLVTALPMTADPSVNTGGLMSVDNTGIVYWDNSFSSGERARIRFDTLGRVVITQGYGSTTTHVFDGAAWVAYTGDYGMPFLTSFVVFGSDGSETQAYMNSGPYPRQVLTTSLQALSNNRVWCWQAWLNGEDLYYMDAHLWDNGDPYPMFTATLRRADLVEGAL